MDFFKILNGGIGVGMSNFDRLWAKKFSDWPETELTGLLPLTFLAEGSALTDYRIYGTENGAGVHTESGEPAGYKIPILISDKKPEIYGWHVDPSISDPAQAVTYIGDAVGKTPAAMGASTFSYGDWSNAFFMPKPCVVKSNGTVDYYLDPNDYTKKLDGTASDVADASYDGNAMMEWPLIWWKYEAGEAEGEGYFYVSNVKVDNTYNCYCNINCDNQIVEHFYTAIYNGTGTTKLRSISGVALTSANGNGGTTYSQESTRAMANNTTAKTEWFIDVWSDRMLINGLLILMGKSLNSQATFGRGLDTGSQAAKEAYVTGTLNDKGLFWGVTSAGTSGVKVFGMENWYSCAWHRTAGLIGLANGNTAYKMTYGTADGTTANGYNTTGDGYHINTVARPSSNYVKSCKFGDFGYLPLSTTGGSASTYYADYWYTNNSALTFALVGGDSSHGAYDGVSYVGLSIGAGLAYWAIAAALTLKPLANPVTPHTSTYNLYIGDSKLGEDEYLDYGEQKVYKRTANLWDIKQFAEGYYNNSGELITQAGQYRTCHTDLISTSGETTYTISGLWVYVLGSSKFAVYEWDENKNWLRRSNRQTPSSSITFTIGSDAKYISFQVQNNDTNWNVNTMLVEGSTAPQSYIPYLQPTDPPIPLPAIQTYQGENTLSSEETVGEVSVTGKIKEAP